MNDNEPNKSKNRGPQGGNSNVPKGSFKVSFLDRIPFFIKALVVKYWFYGMEYFFFIMGLTSWMDVKDAAYLFVFEFLVMGVAIGFSNDFMVNNILEVFEVKKGESRSYYLFKSKKWWSVLINLPFGLLVSYLAFLLAGIFGNMLVYSLGQNASWVFHEAFSFALLALAIEAVFVLLKDLIVHFSKTYGGSMA